VLQLQTNEGEARQVNVLCGVDTGNIGWLTHFLFFIVGRVVTSGNGCGVSYAFRSYKLHDANPMPWEDQTPTNNLATEKPD